ncbi:MAG: hypothetical protein ACTS1X_02640 [Parasphingopyxis sp.]|uniref:hypothetical protein n=1 Tax=Parasphingopyxis sp. TaxID=1920299 RepID=UPI003F9F9C20
MKKLVYAALVALVGSPPAIAQNSDTVEDAEAAAEADFDKPEPAAQDIEPLSEEEAAANDAAKAELGISEEEGEKPSDPAE